MATSQLWNRQARVRKYLGKAIATSEHDVNILLRYRSRIAPDRLESLRSHPQGILLAISRCSGVFPGVIGRNPELLHLEVNIDHVFRTSLHERDVHGH